MWNISFQSIGLGCGKGEDVRFHDLEDHRARPDNQAVRATTAIGVPAPPACAVVKRRNSTAEVSPDPAENNRQKQ